MSVMHDIEKVLRVMWFSFIIGSLFILRGGSGTFQSPPEIRGRQIDLTPFPTSLLGF
jgi:hypothetical protein